jgi:hypothetical protein
MSLISRIFLITIVLIFMAPGVSAQEDRYRVEILVLTHLQHDEEPRKALWIPDYSDSVDFLTPPPEEEEDESEEAPEEVAELTAEMNEGNASELSAEETEEEAPDPNAVIHVEEMSPEMQDAWRRLRLSAPFRPEIFLSWEQGSAEPFPLLRLHDLEPVDREDPWAEQRQALAEAEAEAALALEESGGAQVFGDAAGLAEMGQEPEEESEPELPPPNMFYRLDGTAQLRRSRFLHLHFDLQLREPVFEEETAGFDSPGSLMATRPEEEELRSPSSGLVGDSASDTFEEESAEPALPEPSSFLVHSLKQNRQVRSGRMEYFDGPVLSVLALITPIEPEEEEANP